MAPRHTFTQASPEDVIGSSFHGYLLASYEELAEKLGLPHECQQESEWRSADDQTRVIWAFRSVGHKRPMVLTLYDRHEYQRAVQMINQWHVGIKGDAHQDRKSVV